MANETVTPPSTSDDLNWMLTFNTKPEGIESLPKGVGPGTRIEAYAAHFQVCFEKLSGMLGPDIQVIKKMEYVGSMVISGSPEACQQLKEKVEKDGWAIMAKNSRCIRPAKST